MADERTAAKRDWSEFTEHPGTYETASAAYSPSREVLQRHAARRRQIEREIAAEACVCGHPREAHPGIRHVGGRYTDHCTATVYGDDSAYPCGCSEFTKAVLS